ncbi:MAG: ATP-binding cassette domain-containing protein, partial [Ornithinibacter sp.]
ATVAAALLADPAAVGAPVAALLVVVPVAVGDALAPLVDTMRSLARAQGSAARLDTLLDQEPAVSTPAEPSRVPAAGADGPVLDLAGASASWDGQRESVPPTDLHLPRGRHVALIGPNGSGKSTLLGVIARYLDPSAGTYRLDGVDVAGLDAREVRQHIAVVDDEPHVLATSVAENLRLARPGATDGELRVALDRSGLGNWLDGLPDGLETRLGTGGRGLSGGERTRLGVARAVLADRPVVLLDEPTAHLDHPTATAVLDDVLAATTDSTVVLVSHRSEALDRFDSVLDLSGTPPVSARKE